MGLTGATLQSILESLVCIIAGMAVSLAFGWKVRSLLIAFYLRQMSDPDDVL